MGNSSPLFQIIGEGEGPQCHLGIPPFSGVKALRVIYGGK